jgi:ketosteroid isomerase-like protein
MAGSCLFLAAMPVFLAGCEPPHEPEAVDDEAAILAMTAQRLEGIQYGPDLESKVAAYTSVVAPDAVLMPPNSPPVEGPAAIEEWALPFFGAWVSPVTRNI